MAGGRESGCARQQSAVFLDAPRDRRGHADPRGALRQLLRQRLAFTEVVVDDDLLLAGQSLANALGVHVGGAVHVAAHPGAEAHDQWQFQRLRIGAVERGQGDRQLLIEHWHDSVQHFGKIENGVLALVGHCQQLSRVLRGLPLHGHVGANARQQRRFFLRRQQWIAALQQPIGDALLAAQSGAPCRFGGMRHQHRFDAQLSQQIQHVAERQALGLERGQRIDHAVRLRPLGVGEEILATSANAMHLLRHVGELKVRRKGAQQIARQLRATTLNTRAQFNRHVGTAHAATDRRLPVPLGELVELFAPLLAQYAADDFAERMDVLAQRAVVGREMAVVAVHGADCWRHGWQAAHCTCNGSAGQQHRFRMLERLRRAVDQDNVALAQLGGRVGLTAGDAMAPHCGEGHVGALRSYFLESPAHRPGARRQHDRAQLVAEGVGIVDDLRAVMSEHIAQRRVTAGPDSADGAHAPWKPAA